MTDTLKDITEEYKESVCQNLNTTQEQLKRNVDLLREWIRTQPHLPQQGATDTMLTTFLVACKNRIEWAQQKIDNYYTVRGKYPDSYDGRDPTDERFLEANRELRYFIAPKLSPDGCRLVVMDLATGDVDKFDIVYYLKRMMAQEDLKMHREPFNKGRYVIFDSANLTASHMIRLTLKSMKTLMHCSQDVLPVNIKGVFFLNAPAVLDGLLLLIRPLTKSKLLQRFHIHKEGPEVLEKYFPKEILPKDYGGQQDTIENLNEAWLQCLIENKDWLLADGALRTDESKRIKAKTRQDNDEFSTNVGSFRSLSID